MKTFISYSHQDESWFDLLKIHIAPLIRKGDLSIWSDHEVLAGQPLNSEISKNMESAELFLLLLSPAYFASDYCMNVELNHALVRHQSDDVKIVPIIVEACNWQSISELNDLKIIPKDAKPISNWKDRNTAFVEVVEEIDRLLSTELIEKKNVISDNEYTSPVLTGTNGNGIKQNLLVELDAQELVKQLEHGRKSFSGIKVKDLELIDYDLQNTDFSGSDLSGAVLEGTNLSRANLVGTNLTNANLYVSNLSGVNLMTATLQNAKLIGTDLQCANMCYCNLRGSNLEEADLGAVNMVKADLEGANLFATNMICATLWYSKIVKANLEGVNLRSANLIYSKLNGATLVNANLRYANLLRADLSCTNLENAELSYSNLTQAILDGANINGVRFVGAIR